MCYFLVPLSNIVCLFTHGFSETVLLKNTQGFCVADFATLSDERRSRSKIFCCLIWIKEPCIRKFGGLARSKLLGISQTKSSKL